MFFTWGAKEQEESVLGDDRQSSNVWTDLTNKSGAAYLSWVEISLSTLIRYSITNDTSELIIII